MSIAEKLTTIAKNEQRVYDSGYSKAESDMWDGIQDFGDRTNYEKAFEYWGAEYIRPKYKVVPSSSSRNYYIFDNCLKLKKLEAKYFDFSAYTPNALASSTSCNYYTFSGCWELQEIEDIGIQAGGYYGTFNGCLKLETITIMRCIKDGTYSATFKNCFVLKNITIEGEIGNNISFQYSPLLTIESLRSIFSALYDFVGNGETTTRTITLHKDAYVRTPEEVIEEAKGKGWSVVVDD